MTIYYSAYVYEWTVIGSDGNEYHAMIAYGTTMTGGDS